MSQALRDLQASAVAAVLDAGFAARRQDHPFREQLSIIRCGEAESAIQRLRNIPHLESADQLGRAAAAGFSESAAL